MFIVQRRRFPPSEQKRVDSQISEWLQSRIISESNSDYASQELLIRISLPLYRFSSIEYKNVLRFLFTTSQLENLQSCIFFYHKLMK